MTIRLSASILCGDLLDLRTELRSLAQAGLDAVHVDVIDGHLVPNMGIGYETLAAMVAESTLPVEVHVAGVTVEELVGPLVKIGPALITVQLEGAEDPRGIIERIHGGGIDAGVALAPATDAARVDPFLRQVERLTILTVQPGFAGQDLAAGAMDRVRTLTARARLAAPRLAVEADGHMAPSVIAQVRSYGVSHVVLGTSALFRPGVDRSQVVAAIRGQTVLPQVREGGDDDG